MIKKFNPFHLVDKSPWPILASFSVLTLVRATLIIVNKKIFNILLLTLAITAMIAYIWWRDVHRESSNQGHHSHLVVKGVKTGMVLFISSEVLFFVSFFWAFFHRSISPTIELGQNWPPLSILSFNPIRIPLLNTILLLSSGVTVTWAHHSMLEKNYSTSQNALAATVFLGVIFSIFQGFEYREAPFCIADAAFGSTFFIATGFHGLHVIIGSIFLIISLIRFNTLINPKSHILGFECAAWYWHFVDIVWLFLYSIIYWWGAYLYSIRVLLISN